ncbi:hypothetical protein F2P81_016585 [Scophthalmus maximus]|uniref:Cyclic AMP-responsive element-binding protein 3-like protein 4 n=1 Tax=Scophthalmus maximus TaxID=52904 RepID=A0A6A4SJJ4_SCOMX|nr:hypothetical protein F2P81_016585 [Scophthalmus maximus]
MGNITSSEISLSTGAPQGCVLSPLLYALYTHNCVATHTSDAIVKFADDTIIIGLINDDETSYREEVEALASCFALHGWGNIGPSLVLLSTRCGLELSNEPSGNVLSSGVSFPTVYKEGPFSVLVVLGPFTAEGLLVSRFHCLQSSASGGCHFGKLSDEPEQALSNYPDVTHVDNDAKIEARILEKIKTCGKYNLLTNNCEHLATYVRYGVASTKQDQVPDQDQDQDQVPDQDQDQEQEQDQDQVPDQDQEQDQDQDQEQDQAMDAESGELLFLGGGVAADSWQLDAPLSCSELVYGGSEKPLQDWAVDPDCATANCDSESEDVLHAVDPNEVFPNGPPADPSSESDSGVSEEPVVESPVAVATEATVYQVVYDISGLRGVKAEPGRENVISIELDEWSSQMLFSDSCIVSELPLVAAPLSTDDDLLNPDLQLTEEEQKLLNQEGVSLPNNLPLTKVRRAEERVLKKVRRKIRNKQSAQDSRRRRKEYVDGLESRSLLSQLRRLQSLIKQTVSKGAQTSTCLLIILVSLGLIIMPSFSPFRRNTSVDDDYRPVGVMSRNILTDPSSSSSSSSSQPATDEVESPAAQPDSMSPPAADASQSGRPQGAAAHPREPIEDPVHPGVDEEGSPAPNQSHSQTCCDPRFKEQFTLFNNMLILRKSVRLLFLHVNVRLQLSSGLDGSC